VERCRHYAESALSLVTPLVPVIGYAAAADVARKALAGGKSIQEVVRELKLLPEEQAQELLDPRNMLPR